MFGGPAGGGGEEAAAGFSYGAHTADLQVIGWGPERNEAIRQVLLGIVALIAPEGCLESRQTIEARISAPDPVAALVQAANELLFLVDTEGFVAADVLVSEEPGRAAGADIVSLLLELRGAPVFAEGAVPSGPVPKAATYHEALLEPDCAAPWRWRARLTLDL